MPREYTIARINKGGENFEVLVDPENALKFKLGENVQSSKIIVYEQIYKDAKKGIRAKEEELRRFFGTTDAASIAARIVKEGELQVTADQRRRLIEDKKRQIVDFISRNAVDPRTNLPVPPQRIMLAMEEAGIPVDPFVDAKQQAPKVIEKLRTVLPLKVGLSIFYIKVPGQAYSKSLSYLRSVGRIIKEEWKGDGSWVCELEAPAGMQAELIDKMGRLSSGQAEVKLKEV